MTGIFDSGVGGLAALAELRRLKPNADICFLADRKNAPYGTKSRAQLCDLVNRDIESLLARGCSDILIACCTASTVYSELAAEHKRICVPIITPTCRAAARLTANRRIGVIATEATVASGAFEKEIKKLSPRAEVFSVAAQSLVRIIENGENDANLTELGRQRIQNLLIPIEDADCDVLILGCTHFTHIRRTVEDILKIKTLSPALIGARLISHRTENVGEGRTLYI